MNNNNNLQRMIIIPPEVFNKWKHIITEDQKLTDLDKKMKNIIYNNNLNDIDKWYQYRENLLKYSFAKKGNAILKHSLKPITSEKSMQTNRIPKFDKLQQTNDQINTIESKIQNQSTQTDNMNQQFIDDKASTEVFETQNDENIGDYNNDDDNEDDDDDVMREIALEGHPPDVSIIKERNSIDPSYKSFELSNGEVVSIPTRVTTRSMKKSNEYMTDSPKKLTSLKQTPLPFKKVKKSSSTRPRVNSKGKITPSPSKGDNIITWTKLK